MTTAVRHYAVVSRDHSKIWWRRVLDFLWKRIGLPPAQYVTCIVAYSYFRYMFRRKNKLVIIGQENLPLDRHGVLFACEHWSLLCSFLQGMLYGWWDIVDQRRLPVNCPDQTNFCPTFWWRFFFSLLRTIVVRKTAAGDRTDPVALRQSWRIIRNRNLNTFPAAGRQLPGQTYRPKRGYGSTVLTADKVVPIVHEGMRLVQPYRKSRRDLPKRVLSDLVKG